MNTDIIFILYLGLIVTPLVGGTIYAIYLFCDSQIKLSFLEKELKAEKIKTEKEKIKVLLKLNLHLSQTENHEQKQIEVLSEIKRELKNI